MNAKFVVFSLLMFSLLSNPGNAMTAGETTMVSNAAERGRKLAGNLLAQSASKGFGSAVEAKTAKYWTDKASEK